MARIDIFALPMEWQDDTREDTYVDLDGTEVTYTIDRIARQINNVMSGHHPACGMDDCKMLQPSFFMPEPVAMCLVYGPTTPEIQAANKAMDATIEADIAQNYPGLARRIGFDPGRAI